MKIYQRRQQKHESFHEFYFEMEKLFRTMSCQIPNVEKMQIIQQNMRIDYKRQMTFLPIADLETLVAAGQKLDALNFSAYNKVFGVDRTVQAVNHKEASGKNKQKGLLSFTALQESDQIASVSPSTQYNSNRNNRPSNPSQNSVTKPNTANNQSTQRVNTPIRSPSKEPTPSPRAGPSGTQSRPTLTLEEVVNNHAPPPNNTCYNCVVSNQTPPPFWESAPSNLYVNDADVCQITYPFENDNRPYMAVRIYGFPIRALLDSGSNYTIISEAIFSKLNSKRLHKTPGNIFLRSASGDPLQVIGQAQLPFSVDGKIRIVPTLVVANLTIDCICGMDFWRKFNVQPKMLSNVTKATISTVEESLNESVLSDDQTRVIEQVKKEFLPAREGSLTLTPLAQHRIVLKEEWRKHPPVRQFPYCMSPKTQELVAVELKRLLDIGIIERSQSDWSLNCVPVIKPGKVPLDLESRKYTAFSVQGKGLFQYTRMPFGLINSPATLARLMDTVLSHGVLEPYVFVYLEDIVVVTETQANLTENLEKSSFEVSEVPFLGYLLSTNGLRTNPDKLRPIVEYERPTTITKLRRFLGMVNYYRRFIADFSGVTAPLSDLLKTKSKVIRWNDSCEEAFCKIKELLISSPILGSPDFTKEFVIQTDASDVAVAGVLTQEQKGGERVIAYYSHKLTTPQKNYHAAEKEALAAILAIDAFRGYIEGYHFTLITDSSALTHILKTKWKVGSRCSRWSLDLQQFDMTVIHRKGRENVVADALSRSLVATLDSTDSSWYSSMMDKVMSQPDDYVDFKVENGLLFKFVSAQDHPYDSRFEWKIIPQTTEIPGILKASHDSCLHPGYEKTLARIRQRDMQDL
ncbi:uncharacterized protein LOC134203871 [Armigeres subalbatus]|uniref:uncharacterized protein LOC134203871 n=1 Tax=Armigeres subalbatus TaxID=124917 RepID=UPI002ED432FB